MPSMTKLGFMPLITTFVARNGQSVQFLLKKFNYKLSVPLFKGSKYSLWVTMGVFLHDKSITESQLKILKMAMRILKAIALGAQV